MGREARANQARRERANTQLRELMCTHYAETDARTAHDVRPDEVSCSKGCSACCGQLIVATMPEAVYIVERYPDLVRAALSRLREQDAELDRICSGIERAGLGDPIKTSEGTEALCAAWWRASNTRRCAFLRDDLCSIYDARPRACRTYFVRSDPSLCGADVGVAVEIVDPNSRHNGDVDMFELCAQTFGAMLVGPLPPLLIEAWRRRVVREPSHG